jgi:hypothetical protein
LNQPSFSLFTLVTLFRRDPKADSGHVCRFNCFSHTSKAAR